MVDRRTTTTDFHLDPGCDAPLLPQLNKLETRFSVKIKVQRERLLDTWVTIEGSKEDTAAAKKYIMAMCCPEETINKRIPEELSVMLMNPTILLSLEEKSGAMITPDPGTNFITIQGDTLAVTLAFSGVEDEIYKYVARQTTYASSLGATGRKSESASAQSSVATIEDAVNYPRADETNIQEVSMDISGLDEFDDDNDYQSVTYSEETTRRINNSLLAMASTVDMPIQSMERMPNDVKKLILSWGSKTEDTAPDETIELLDDTVRDQAEGGHTESSDELDLTTRQIEVCQLDDSDDDIEEISSLGQSPVASTPAGPMRVLANPTCFQGESGVATKISAPIQLVLSSDEEEDDAQKDIIMVKAPVNQISTTRAVMVEEAKKRGYSDQEISEGLSRMKPKNMTICDLLVVLGKLKSGTYEELSSTSSSEDGMESSALQSVKTERTRPRNVALASIALHSKRECTNSPQSKPADKRKRDDFYEPVDAVTTAAGEVQKIGQIASAPQEFYKTSSVIVSSQATSAVSTNSVSAPPAGASTGSVYAELSRKAEEAYRAHNIELPTEWEAHHTLDSTPTQGKTANSSVEFSLRKDDTVAAVQKIQKSGENSFQKPPSHNIPYGNTSEPTNLPASAGKPSAVKPSLPVKSGSLGELLQMRQSQVTKTSRSDQSAVPTFQAVEASHTAIDDMTRQSQPGHSLSNNKRRGDSRADVSWYDCPSSSSNLATRSVAHVSEQTNHKKRFVVLDGSNIAFKHSGSKRIFSSRGIEIAINYLRERHGVTDLCAIVPNFRQGAPDTLDKHVLQRLADKDLLFFSPSKRLTDGRFILPYDDRFILDLALERDGVIISNDKYQDLAQERKYNDLINNRVIMYCFVRDTFMIPDDPMGRSGPSLSELLKRPKRQDFSGYDNLHAVDSRSGGPKLFMDSVTGQTSSIPISVTFHPQSGFRSVSRPLPDISFSSGETHSLFEYDHQTVNQISSRAQEEIKARLSELFPDNIDTINEVVSTNPTVDDLNHLSELILSKCADPPDLSSLDHVVDESPRSSLQLAHLPTSRVEKALMDRHTGGSDSVEGELSKTQSQRYTRQQLKLRKQLLDIFPLQKSVVDKVLQENPREKYDQLVFLILDELLADLNAEITAEGRQCGSTAPSTSNVLSSNEASSPQNSTEMYYGRMLLLAIFPEHALTVDRVLRIHGTDTNLSGLVNFVNGRLPEPFPAEVCLERLQTYIKQQNTQKTRTPSVVRASMSVVEPDSIYVKARSEEETSLLVQRLLELFPDNIETIHRTLQKNPYDSNLDTLTELVRSAVTVSGEFVEARKEGGKPLRQRVLEYEHLRVGSVSPLHTQSTYGSKSQEHALSGYPVRSQSAYSSETVSKPYFTGNVSRQPAYVGLLRESNLKDVTNVDISAYSGLPGPAEHSYDYYRDSFKRSSTESNLYGNYPRELAYGSTSRAGTGSYSNLGESAYGSNSRVDSVSGHDVRKAAYQNLSRAGARSGPDIEASTSGYSSRGGTLSGDIAREAAYGKSARAAAVMGHDLWEYSHGNTSRTGYLSNDSARKVGESSSRVDAVNDHELVMSRDRSLSRRVELFGDNFTISTDLNPRSRDHPSRTKSSSDYIS